MTSGHDVALCIPTLNAGAWVDRIVTAVAEQHLQPDDVIIIDSSSTDGSPARWADSGARVVSIERDDFDHGGTRNRFLDLTDAAVLLFLTQDAVPAGPAAFEALVAGLTARPETGLAYGRQLPHPGAQPMARAHRAFNYPATPAYRTADDVAELGVRAAFSSNAFAAYRRAALESVGRFPDPIVGSEDRWVAARLLQEGWGIAYVPDAQVEHSHDDGYADNVRRYFDIGTFQSSQPWFEAYLGRPDREGRRLVGAQITALQQAGVRGARPRVLAHAAASWAGFRLGRAHRLLPRPVAARLSTAPAYFRNRRMNPG